MLEQEDEPVSADASAGNWPRRIDDEFDRLLLGHRHQPQGRLYAAMHYGVAGGGKRLRPLLVRASAKLFDVPDSRSLRAGLAVEAIHAHSLIHDDLPCMDDDDLRRGRPTVHRAFDEATAVLAGDSLFALAFQIIAEPETHPDPEVRSALAASLAAAAGPAGMAGGQMIDMLAPMLDLDLEGVAQLQRLKTGALISWSVEAGILLGGASAGQQRALRAYASALGLVFQIADDLLDLEGTEASTGKRTGKDQAAGKQTFVSILGAEQARRSARQLVAEAKTRVRPLGPGADLLVAIADFALARDH